MEKQIFTFPLDPTYKDVFGIAKTISGYYVCPGWHPVPEGTTRDQIRFEEDVNTVKTTTAPESPKVSLAQRWEVNGSKLGVKYTVEFNGSYWTCSCPSKQFHRGDCKHIKSKKEETEKSL